MVRRFQDLAVGYAYALLGDWQEAEDAAQEAFIAAWSGMIKLRDEAAFPGWFRRIVHTQAHRRLRLRRTELVSLEQVAEMAVGSAEPVMVAEEIATALDALPEAQRTVTLLHYMNDFRQHEIAAFLDFPLGTVKSRLYHARKQMKERLMELSDIPTKRPSRDSQFTKKIMRLFDAAKSGDSALVKRLLDQDSRLAKASGCVRTSLLGSDAQALHVAVMHGRKDIVDLLLAAGADVNARDGNGNTPLHFAICFGPKEFLDPLPDLTEATQDIGVYRLLTKVPQFLVDRGADLRARESQGDRTPLELAMSPFEDETDHSEVIALLETAAAA